MLERKNTVPWCFRKRKNDFQLGKRALPSRGNNWEGSPRSNEWDLNKKRGRNGKEHSLSSTNIHLLLNLSLSFWHGTASHYHVLFSVLWGKRTSWSFSLSAVVTEVFQVMKGKDLHPRLLYPAKLSFRMQGKIKCFSDKVKLKKFIITKPLLYEMLKGLI